MKLLHNQGVAVRRVALAAELLARGEKFPRSIKRSDLPHGEISTEMEVTRGPKCPSVFYRPDQASILGYWQDSKADMHETAVTCPKSQTANRGFFAASGA